MIRIDRHKQTKYLEVRAPFQHKDDIKRLADYPDVKWYPDGKCWLVDALLFDKFAMTHGHLFYPLEIDLVLWLPVPTVGAAQKPVRRRTKRQIMADKTEDQERARAAGRMIVEYGRARRGA